MPFTLIPALLQPTPAPSAADEAAFRAYTATLARQLGLVGAAVLLVATVAWWPLDAVLLPEGAGRAAFTRLRTHAVAVEVAAIGGLTLLPLRASMVPPLAVGLHAAFLFALGEALGTVAGADRGQLAWLADAWLGVVPLAFAPFPLAIRVPAALTVAGALAAGFFLVHPGNLALPGAGVQLSFGGFAVAFSVVMGEASYRVTRRVFFERLALDRTRADLAALSDSLADQVAQRTERLRALASHLEQTQEAERRRLAHDLHDDLGQQLTAMRYTVTRLRARLGDAPPALVDDLEALVDGTSDATRAALTRLHPRILDDLGLLPAIAWLCEDAGERAGLPCTLHAPAVPEKLEALAPTARLALFRVVQEGVTNALRHAAGSRVDVAVDADPHEVRVTVTDDGRGFDPAQAHPGFGLLGLRERLHALGGSLVVERRDEGGTRLRAALAWPAAGSAA